MRQHVLEAVSPEGRRELHRIAAESAEVAMEALAARGYRGIRVLVRDELPPGVVLRRELAAKAEALPPQDQVALWQPMSQLAMALVIAAQVAWAARWACLAAAGLLVWRRLSGDAAGIFDWIAIAILAAPVLYGFHSTFFGSAGHYQRYREAVAECQWDAALAAVERLERTLSPFLVAASRGRVFAGMGRVEEGLALLDPFAGDEAVPERDWLTQRGLILGQGCRFDAHLEVTEAMLLRDRENSALLLDLALLRLLYRRDLAGARAAYARVRPRSLPVWVDTTLAFVSGLLAFEGGDAVSAEASMREVMVALERKARSTPELRGLRDLAQLYHGMALARLGRLDEATRVVDAVAPRFERSAERVYVERARAELAGARPVTPAA